MSTYILADYAVAQGPEQLNCQSIMHTGWYAEKSTQTKPKAPLHGYSFTWLLQLKYENPAAATQNMQSSERSDTC